MNQNLGCSYDEFEQQSLQVLHKHYFKKQASFYMCDDFFIPEFFFAELDEHMSDDLTWYFSCYLFSNLLLMTCIPYCSF